MKILVYGTPECEGHHHSYFCAIVKSIIEKYGEESVVTLTPEKCFDVSCRQRHITGINWGTKSFVEYYKLITAVIKIANEEKPDCIHIQCGDNFYRFFGIGFSKLKKYNPIITFHHMKRSKLRDISLRRIFNNIFCGVVHTVALKKMLIEMNIKNVEHIEYPQFCESETVDPLMARNKLGLRPEVPILLALGATREDKGLGILLEALKYVKQDFQLLIAGQEADYTKEYINKQTESYADKVTCLLKFLNDDEFSMCLSAADFVVLPYKKCFDGASGPLGEGVIHGKAIIGPDHGSLGDIIRRNHLGYTFEAENASALSVILSKALVSHFTQDESYSKYQEELNPEHFLKKYHVLFERIVERKSEIYK